MTKNLLLQKSDKQPRTVIASKIIIGLCLFGFLLTLLFYILFNRYVIGGKEQHDAAYYHRVGISNLDSRNYGEAIKNFLKAAELGNAKSQHELGQCYFEGLGVKKNEVESFNWWQKAANLGHAGSQNNLGKCYLNGKGVEKNEIEGFKWFQKAANLGYAEAQYNLGVCYFEGQGVEKN
jgi:TPR repeat protein